MNDYIIITDSDSDIPFSLQQRWQVPYVSMPYLVDGREYHDDLGQSLDMHSYFELMRQGAAPMTSSLNNDDYMAIFEPYLKAGQDLLFLAFSRKLSRTLDSAFAVKDMLKEKYPERRLEIVDTLCITGPECLLVLHALEMRANGADMDAVIAWVEEHKHHTQAFLMVEDLKYLVRGGRLSKIAGAMGTLLDLKPLITLTRDGRLTSGAKVRGHKKAVSTMLEYCQTMRDPDQPAVVVMHADCEEEALQFKAMIEAHCPGTCVTIVAIGPVIGAHTGPGALGIAFIGGERIDG